MMSEPLEASIDSFDTWIDKDSDEVLDPKTGPFVAR
jgi:hypothetical protein